MAILTLPGGPDFTESFFGLVSNTQSDLSSPLDQSSQIFELPGARWRARYALPPLHGGYGGHAAAIAAWRSFFVRLRGRAGQFYGFDPDHRTARGTAKDKSFGTLKVMGADQSGAALAIDGAGASEAGVFLAGDMLAYDVAGGAGRQLHMVTADADADGAGALSLAIEPPIRLSPADDADIIAAAPSCVMRLVGDEIGWEVDRRGVHRIAFETVEIFGS